MKDAGVVDTVKVLPIPKSKNHIHLRLQNMADLYDSNAKTYQVSVSAIAAALWRQANQLKPVDFSSIKITEMSLSGNMDIKEMRARKIHWITRDDAKLAASSVNYEFCPDHVQVEPQRIRVFSIEYGSKMEDTPVFLN